MKQSAKTALGGMVAALSVVLLALTIIPVFVYTMPALASALILLIVIEVDKKWAFGVYAAASIVGFFVAPDKEAAIVYIAFFGYYPIVKSVFESKLPRALEYVAKFAVFNCAIVAAYAVIIKVMGLMTLEEMTEFPSYPALAKFALPILLVLANVMFFVYDICLSRLVTLYIHRWQNKFRRLFRH